MPTLWDRTKQAFEKTLEESRKASERAVETLGEAGETAKARVEKARLERKLFKLFAELGSRVFEQSSTTSGADLLQDARVKELLGEIGTLESEIEKLDK
jgi:hypothetical protein